MMVWAIVGIGALSFVVWAHHMYVSGMNPYFGFFFATTTLIIAIPTAIKVYNWVLTLWRGDIHLTLPMLFALAFIVTFVNGGLTGLFLGNVVVDVPLSDTMFVVAHFHMVMGVAPILVIFGAIYHWYPKITGRMLDERARPVPLLGHVPRRLSDLLPDALSRADGRAAPLQRARRDGADPAIGPPAQRLHHASWPSSSASRSWSSCSTCSGASGTAARRAAIPGAQRRSNGRPRPRRRRTATGARTLPVVYRWAYDYSVPGAKQDFLPQNEPGRFGPAREHA